MTLVEMRKPDKMNWWQEFNRACEVRGLHHSDYDRFDVVSEWFEKHPYLPEAAAEGYRAELQRRTAE